MFLEFSIKDAVDIVLVALLLYYFYKLMKDSGSLNVFLGILVFLFSLELQILQFQSILQALFPECSGSRTSDFFENGVQIIFVAEPRQLSDFAQRKLGVFKVLRHPDPQ